MFFLFDSQKRSKLKKKVWNLLESTSRTDKWSNIVERGIEILILLNVVVVILESNEEWNIKYHVFFNAFEIFTVIIFTIEYVLRLWISDLKYRGKKIRFKRLRYAFSLVAIIDLIAIVPDLLPFFGDHDLRHIRIITLMRIFKAFKMNRYSASFNMIVQIFVEKRRELGISTFLTFSSIIIASTLFFYIERNVQKENLPNILHAFYWAVSTITTLGYGDIVPLTGVGKLIGSFVALMGIIIVALPTGIISSSFVQKMEENYYDKRIGHVRRVLKDAFYKKYVPELAAKVRRGSISVEAIKVNLELSEEDLYKVAEGKNEFRFRVKKTVSNGVYMDKISLEYNEVNSSYGTLKLRDDILSIVSPESLDKQSVSYLGYLISEKLKCNFISNEFYGNEVDIYDESFGDKGLEIENAFSFKHNKAYFNEKVERPEEFNLWMRDLQRINKDSSICVIINTFEHRSKVFAYLTTLKKKNIITKTLEFTLAKNEILDKFKDSLLTKVAGRFGEENPLIEVNANQYSIRDNNMLQFIHESTGKDTVMIYLNQDYLLNEKIFITASLLCEAIKEELIGVDYDIFKASKPKKEANEDDVEEEESDDE